MASERRLEKLNNLLREELSKILQEEVEFPQGIMVTITKVVISPDVHYANVLISVLGGHTKKILEILSEKVYNIQQILNKRVRMRPVPRINFLLDREEINREKVEKSLAELKREGEI